jgi:hypothetical protein
VATNICAVLGASTCFNPIRPIAYNGCAGDNHDTSAFLPPTSTNSLPWPMLRPPIHSTLTSRCRQQAPPRTSRGLGGIVSCGPRYQDIDLTVAKEFGLPETRVFEKGKIHAASAPIFLRRGRTSLP